MSTWKKEPACAALSAYFFGRSQRPASVVVLLFLSAFPKLFTACVNGPFLRARCGSESCNRAQKIHQCVADFLSVSCSNGSSSDHCLPCRFFPFMALRLRADAGPCVVSGRFVAPEAFLAL